MKPKTTTRTRSPSERREPSFREVRDVSKPRSFVFYGRSGTGKTTLASSFPKPIAYADVKDEGTDSISDVKGVQVTEITSWEDLEDLYWYLKKNPTKFKTVVIDTVTQLQQICVEDVLIRKKKDPSKAGDWGVMTKREWGEVSQLMKTWIINFRDLPMEVVFIAQDRVFNFDEESADTEEQLAPEIGPRLSPSIASTLNAAVSVIGNTYIRLKTYKKEVNGKPVEKTKTEYCLRIGPNPVYMTKIRKPKKSTAPEFIVDPDYEEIINAIKGE